MKMRDIDTPLQSLLGGTFTISVGDDLASQSDCVFEDSDFLHHVGNLEALEVALRDTPTEWDVDNLIDTESQERSAPLYPLEVIPSIEDDSLGSDLSDGTILLTDPDDALVSSIIDVVGNGDDFELHVDDNLFMSILQSTENIGDVTGAASNTPTVAPPQRNTNRWSSEEHERYLQALKQYPPVGGKWPWSAIARVIGTRSSRQAQSHHQKVLAKLKKRKSQVPTRPLHELAPDVVRIAKMLADPALELPSAPNDVEAPVLSTKHTYDYAALNSSQELELHHPGSWSEEEHARYLEAVRRFAPSTPGSRWPVTKMTAYIGTRTRRQVQSHHQKQLRKWRRLDLKDPNAFARRREHRIDGVATLLLGVRD